MLINNFKVTGYHQFKIQNDKFQYRNNLNKIPIKLMLEILIILIYPILMVLCYKHSTTMILKLRTILINNKIKEGVHFTNLSNKIIIKYNLKE